MCHVPDVSIHGKLSALHGALDLSQYKLVRGFFSYHFVETDDVPMPMEIPPEMLSSRDNTPTINLEEKAWTFLAISLDLVNVSIKLQHSHGTTMEDSSIRRTPKTSLACVDFIKSRLLLEILSDGSRDVDLVSQEILITDTRYQDEPVNKRSNVFANILQPIKSASLNSQVQAEVHHRQDLYSFLLLLMKRKDFSKFTILLNNMRLMAILDWWEEIRDFIVQNADSPVDSQSCDRMRKIYQTAEPKTIITEDANKYPFELNLNVTESEVVFVEDTSLWDTNAVILKSTTVISYRPMEVERPLWCNLNHCEVFSCVLGGMEDETALSIIDPVTINMEITCKAIRCPSEEAEAAEAVFDAGQNYSNLLEKVLEVQIAHLSVRLSYHDVRMFSRMLNSIPKQTLSARSQVTGDDTRPANVAIDQIKKLTVLGFAPDDCALALEKCEGELEEAALWLTQNAVPLPAPFFSSHSHFISIGPQTLTADQDSSGVPDGNESNEESILSCDYIEVKMGCFSICIIDDCRDADVPLLELSLAQLELHQRLTPPTPQESSSENLAVREAWGGVASFIFSSDYYNRLLSGWEPFIEPWRCETSWGRSLPSDISRTECLRIELESQKVLNINVTSSLIELYHMVKENWTEDYYSLSSPKGDRYDASGKLVKSSAVSPPGYRRRSPFVPFALQNDTGSPLWFTTVIATPDNLHGSISRMHPSLLSESETTWTSVAPGDVVPFSFEGRGKVRHRDTHKLRLHQIGVRVEGWHPVGPVSVDQVGIFFRHADPEAQFDGGLSVARVVFQVTLEGSARKLVTIRSALLMTNRLKEIIELKMERNSSPDGMHVYVY
ncbi:hypothetical protein J437_LFUL010067 [Ladona fulva]|uniref:UBA domain-containing protein n=1 Tax=Ladona fulva TaxID=123851 RepID=A0A8K0P1F2_LADFU|nr:hypothetical protein J437_LFUL010067 [Ladona fulva]